MRQDSSARLAFPLVCGSLCFALLFLGNFFPAPFLMLGYLAPLPLFFLGFVLAYGDVLVGALTASLLHVFFTQDCGTQLLAYGIFYVLPPVCFAYAVHVYHRKRHQGNLIKGQAFEPFLGQYFLGGALGLTLLFHFYVSTLLSQGGLEAFIGQLSLFFAQDEVAVQEKIWPWFQDYFAGIVSCSWMLMMGCNVVLAQWLGKRLGSPLGVTLSLKRWHVVGWQYWLLAFMLIGGAMGPLELQNCFKSLAFISLFPFLMEGLSILDGICEVLFKDAPWRTWVLYGLLVVLVWPLGALVCVGLFEPWIHMRRRLGNPS